MTNPYHALCAELVDALAEWRLGGGPPEDTADADLIDRARALLAEPESIQDRIAAADAAIEASMKRIRALAAPALADLAEADGPAVPEGREPASVALQPSDEELETFLVDVACQNGDMYYADPKVLARAVLARWGRPAAAPVPVSERLPGPEDCDAEGRCWLGGRLLGTGTPTWLLGYPDWVERFPDVHRFWLPANACQRPRAGSLSLEA